VCLCLVSAAVFVSVFTLTTNQSYFILNALIKRIEFSFIPGLRRLATKQLEPFRGLQRRQSTSAEVRAKRASKLPLFQHCGAPTAFHFEYSHQADRVLIHSGAATSRRKAAIAFFGGPTSPVLIGRRGALSKCFLCAQRRQSTSAEVRAERASKRPLFQHRGASTACIKLTDTYSMIERE
jgi:hypothetical protein